MASAVAEQAGALVRRARAGDQNAMALIREVGEAARKGVDRAQQAFRAIERYIGSHPAPAMAGGLFGFGGEVGEGLEQAPPALIDERPEPPRPRPILPPLPRGSLSRIFDLEDMPIVVAKACRYRDGLGAAALVLAGGPEITREKVQEMALSLFGSDDASTAFLFGVKNPTDEDREEIAEELDVDLRAPLVAGQCVGRAIRIQQVRQGHPIGIYDPMAGWELGEG